MIEIWRTRDATGAKLIQPHLRLLALSVSPRPMLQRRRLPKSQHCRGALLELLATLATRSLSIWWSICRAQSTEKAKLLVGASSLLCPSAARRNYREMRLTWLWGCIHLPLVLPRSLSPLRSTLAYGTKVGERRVSSASCRQMANSSWLIASFLDRPVNQSRIQDTRRA